MKVIPTDEERFIDTEITRLMGERRQQGRETYGRGLEYDYPGTQSWLDHAIDEALDLLQYLLMQKYGERHRREDAEKINQTEKE